MNTCNSTGLEGVYIPDSMFITDAWLDGQYLGNNRGGYTPFLFSLDEHLKPGENAELVVRVDNRLDNQTIPKSGTGWETYGGLTREVFLITRPKCRVEGLKTVTELESPEGPVRLEVSGNIVNNTVEQIDDVLEITLSDGRDTVGETQRIVSLEPGGEKTFDLKLRLSEARLWSPEDPFLHDLTLRWTGTDRPHVNMPVGLREISIDGPHLLLNGERIWLQGFGQHEMVPDHGPCLPPGWHEKELERMKQFGANHYRTGHYPQHPELYRAADRLGILVFTEIPAWQINRSWLETDRAWEEWARPQLKAMIGWYRNFTSVASWGAANETGGVHEYNRRAVEFIEKKDPTRIPMIVLADTACNMERYYDLLPMGGRNFHYGWYHSRRVYGARSGLESNLRHARRNDMPIWVAELGGMARTGRFSGGYNDQSRGSETYLDKIVRFGFQYHPTATERVCGIAIWTWSDFVRNSSVNRHGIFSYNREPKLVTYTVRNLFEGNLRLFLTEDDTTCKAGGNFNTKIFVFNPKLKTLPDELTVKWQIMKGNEKIEEGNLEVPAERDERSVDIDEVNWNIPEDAKGMYSLWAELRDADGSALHTNSVHFGVEGPDDAVERPGALLLTAMNDGESVEAMAELFGIRMPVYEDPGLYIPLSEGEYEITIYYQDDKKTIATTVEAGARTEKEVEF